MRRTRGILFIVALASLTASAGRGVAAPQDTTAPECQASEQRPIPSIPPTLRGGRAIDDFVWALAASMPEGSSTTIWAREIGRSQKRNAILMVSLARTDAPDVPRANVMVVAAQHGNEPAGTRAALELIRAVVTGEEELPPGVIVHIVPVANPDGTMAFRRLTANGGNINRDWNSRVLPETRAIERTIEEIDPDVLIDLHEQTPGCPAGMYVAGGPADRAAGILGAVSQALKDHGLKVPVRKEGRSGSTRLLHRHFAAAYDRPALIVESKYTRKAEADLKARSAIHKTTVMAVLQSLSTRASGTASARSEPMETRATRSREAR